MPLANAAAEHPWSTQAREGACWLVGHVLRGRGVRSLGGMLPAMGRYTDFRLYWEIWNGYPDREEPFANPNLVWVIASDDNASVCSVRREPGPSAHEIVWNARWRRLAVDEFRDLLGLLDQAQHAPLSTAVAGGDYLIAWKVTGVRSRRPFGLSAEYTAGPGGAGLTPLGQRMATMLHALEGR